MRVKKILTIIAVLISILLMFGCAKAEIDSPSISDDIGDNNLDQTVIIGEQLPNPIQCVEHIVILPQRLAY